LSCESTSESLTKVAGHAASWQIFGGIWTTIVRIGASVFLARLLTPEDFGVFGMSLLAYELISAVAAMGMGAGIIARKNVSDIDLCTCFWSMAAVRFFMFCGCFFGAPLAGAFFDNHLLVDVIRVISFTFLISILEVVSAALLTKELKFKTINMIQGITVLIESVFAVLLASFTDLGYWSLVYAMLINSTITSVSLFVLAGWRPKFKFSKESFKYLFNFGANSLGFSFMNYLSNNLDYLLVGKTLGARALGLYEFAYRIPHIIQLRLVQPIGSTLFPTLSKVQDDNEKLLNGYLKTVQFLCLIAFPMLGGLATLADNLVLLLWGEQWVEIIVPLQILCLCAALRVVPQSVGAILFCKKRPDIPFKLSFVSLIWTAICVGIFGVMFGITGVAWGMVLSTIPQYFSIYFAFRLIDKKTFIVLVALKPVVWSTLAMLVVVFTAKSLLLSFALHDAVILLSCIVAGVIVYTLCLFTFFTEFSKDKLDILGEVAGIDLTSKLQWLFIGSEKLRN